jgi:hypothetical protein
MFEIIIEITPEGQTSKTVKGLKGRQCLTHPVVKGLDTALGLRHTRTHTSEFFTTATHVVTQKHVV